jgi:GntR family carbon starvation induced transcriptional regulator
VAKSDSRSAEGGTLADAVSDRMRAEILTARIKPDTKLRLEDLRAEFGVSWSPIREGLNRLVAEGLVVTEEPRGYRVAAVSRAHFSDLVRVRTLVECLALREAILRGDDAWEAGVLAAQHRLSKFEARRWKKGDYDQWESWHRNYHEVLISGCGSPILLQFCSMLFDLRDRYRRLFLTAGHPDRDVGKEHSDITRAALARDADLACPLLARHIERNAKAILSSIRE